MATFRREITPRGRRKLNIGVTDYHLAEEISAWANEIVESAGRPKRPITEFALEDVFQEMEDVFQEMEEVTSNAKSDWKHTVRRLHEAGWLERLKAIQATIAQRGLPYRFRTNMRLFHGLSDHSVPVEVLAIYEIDLANKVVTFHTFGYFTPDPPDTREDAGRAEAW